MNDHEHAKTVERVEDLRREYAPSDELREEMREDDLLEQMERARMEPDLAWRQDTEDVADGWPGGDDGE